MKVKVLRIARQARCLSLEHLQKRTGVNIATISQIERRLVTATPEQRAAIHKMFPGYDEEHLFSDLELGEREPLLSGRHLSDELQALIDKGVEERLTEIRREIAQRQEQTRSAGRDSASQFNRAKI